MFNNNNMATLVVIPEIVGTRTQPGISFSSLHPSNDIRHTSQMSLLSSFQLLRFFPNLFKLLLVAVKKAREAIAAAAAAGD